MSIHVVCFFTPYLIYSPFRVKLRDKHDYIFLVFNNRRGEEEEEEVKLNK